MLNLGMCLQSDQFGKVIIDQKIGSGGQGDVYRVTANNAKYALKWYTNNKWKTEKHFAAISELVNMGPPNRPVGAGKRFLWPQAIVTGDKDEFGYIMDLFPEGVCGYKEIRSRKRQQPSLKNLCNISFELAHSFRALHLAGYCYRDISEENIQMDPEKGFILICDNDNIGINGNCDIGILGTLPFMAPEVILKQKKPSTLTDQHSLAVLLFYFWMAHNPFHGIQEYNIDCLEEADMIKLYGQSPVFIFDPNNNSNYPPAVYKTVLQRWSMCPVSIRNAFIKAFTFGLKDSNNRVAETSWRSLFLKLRDGVHSCKNCHAEIILDLDDDDLTCWYCKTKIPYPSKLCITQQNKKYEIPLLQNTKIHPYHINPMDNDSYENTNIIIGEVVENPKNPGTWGIRNKTKKSWDYRSKEGGRKEVPPGKAFPLNSKVEAFIDGAQISVISKKNN